MSDPAVEAAKRACQGTGLKPRLPSESQVAAAREALAQAREDLQLVDGVLSLLHHRGLVDTEQNRADVKAALDIVQRYTR